MHYRSVHVENGSKGSTGTSMLRQINERAVFESVRSRGTISKSDLSRRLGVSTTTISKVVSRLLDAGLLEDVGKDGGGRAGRPGRIYRIAGDLTQVIGVTIDVRRCCVFGAGLDGEIRTETVDDFATPQTYHALLDRIAEGIIALCRDASVHTLGIGLSVPGEIDRNAGRVLLCPNLHILDGKTPAGDLNKRLDLTCVMAHETAGTCLAERAYGAARGMDNFVMIGVYEGFGASAFVNGMPILGERGMAMELGHVTVDLNGQQCGCGNRGCLETVATDQSFARRVSRAQGRDLAVEEIIRLAGTGKLNVEQELEETLEYLAVGVGTAINMFNPQAVLVCSRLFDVHHASLSTLRDKVRRRALAPLLTGCQIVRAEGDVKLGAVASILKHLTDVLGPELR